MNPDYNPNHYTDGNGPKGQLDSLYRRAQTANQRAAQQAALFETDNENS